MKLCTRAAVSASLFAAGAANAQSLFSIDTATDELVTINAQTNDVSTVGSLGLDVTSANLTFANGQLSGIINDASGTRSIVSIDTSTGGIASSATLSAGGTPIVLAEGLAADRNTGELYISFSNSSVFDTRSESLGTVALSGEITTIDTFGPAIDIDGFTALGTGSSFFGVDREPGPETLEFALVGADASMTSLATRSFDATMNGLGDFTFDGQRVWSIDFMNDRLLAFDPATAGLTFTGGQADGLADLSGLAIPAPGSVALVAIGAPLLARRRRR